MNAMDFTAAAAAPIAARHAHDHSLLESARTRDSWMRANDRPIEHSEFLDRAKKATADALPNLTPEQQEDLASEVLLSCRRRLGTWTPLSSEVPAKLLAQRAVTHWRDLRTRTGTVGVASLDVATTETEEGDAPAAVDFLIAAAGHTVAPADVGWMTVADALGCATGSPDADAVMCALSGYGTATDLATLRDMSVSGAENRIARGRKLLRDRFPDADALTTALRDADAADRPLTAGPVPVDGRSRWTCPLTGDLTRGPFSALRVINPSPVHDDRVRLSASDTIKRRVLDSMGLTNVTLPRGAEVDLIRAERRTVRVWAQACADARVNHETQRTAPHSAPGSARAVLAYITAVENATGPTQRRRVRPVPVLSPVQVPMVPERVTASATAARMERVRAEYRARAAARTLVAGDWTATGDVTFYGVQTYGAHLIERAMRVPTHKQHTAAMLALWSRAPRTGERTARTAIPLLARPAGPAVKRARWAGKPMVARPCGCDSCEAARKMADGEG